ncbi:hypothetical protein RB7832 [Rhodopirellula baltica SH 1]|uniref:Uncharacterized protein n=1 Tax=Rhodopirellula baltica (strain DSM 10527 / NCIMB 13988 / SH1) TaxID=243090 RepID=Q7UN21_RHOBA|nr:hypothetical protein RB7832 [Rhodopirellula baltica SH 1]
MPPHRGPTQVTPSHTRIGHGFPHGRMSRRNHSGSASADHLSRSLRRSRNS